MRNIKYKNKELNKIYKLRQLFTTSKNSKSGITLVALVVTIIVLIILATISINIIFGEEGILERARQAQETQKEAEIKEKIQMMLPDYLVEKGLNNKKLISYLTEQKDKGNLDNVTDNGDGTITVELDGYQITIRESDLEILDIQKNGKSVTIRLSSTVVKPGEEITAEIILGEEIEYKECKYIITTTKANLGTDAASYTNTFTKKIETIDLTTNTMGTYYIHILVVDKEGNKTEKVSNAVTIMRDEVKLDTELEALLKEANMTITLEDILNTPAIMNEVNGLIPVITEADVTREEIDGVITYTDYTGGIIRTPSENSNGPAYAWKAFDNDATTYACSAVYTATGYYVEYEFLEEVYALQIRYILTNTSSSNGTRVFVIQGFDEEKNDWNDLTEELTWTGAGLKITLTESIENLNYSKAYKRYRIYVKSATGENTAGGANSAVYSMQLYGKRIR